MPNRWSYQDERTARAMGQAVYWAAQGTEIVFEMQYDQEAGTVRVLQAVDGQLEGGSPTGKKSGQSNS